MSENVSEVVWRHYDKLSLNPELKALVAGLVQRLEQEGLVRTDQLATFPEASLATLPVGFRNFLLSKKASSKNPSWLELGTSTRDIHSKMAWVGRWIYTKEALSGDWQKMYSKPALWKTRVEEMLSVSEHKAPPKELPSVFWRDVVDWMESKVPATYEQTKVDHKWRIGTAGGFVIYDEELTSSVLPGQRPVYPFSVNMKIKPNTFTAHSTTPSPKKSPTSSPTSSPRKADGNWDLVGHCVLDRVIAGFGINRKLPEKKPSSEREYPFCLFCMYYSALSPNSEFEEIPL